MRYLQVGLVDGSNYTTRRRDVKKFPILPDAILSDTGIPCDQWVGLRDDQHVTLRFNFLNIAVARDVVIEIAVTIPSQVLREGYTIVIAISTVKNKSALRDCFISYSSQN